MDPTFYGEIAFLNEPEENVYLLKSVKIKNGFGTERKTLISDINGIRTIENIKPVKVVTDKSGTYWIKNSGDVALELYSYSENQLKYFDIDAIDGVKDGDEPYDIFVDDENIKWFTVRNNYWDFSLYSYNDSEWKDYKVDLYVKGMATDKNGKNWFGTTTDYSNDWGLYSLEDTVFVKKQNWNIVSMAKDKN